MSKRAVIYVRVSTDEQAKGYSLQTQKEKCEAHAVERGYTLAATFQDAHTGTELDRPGLNELNQFIADEGVDVLIVYDIDRLSREVGNQAIIEMEMARADVSIEYVLGGYDGTPEGELMKVIKSGIAQYENRQRVERSRRGKAGRVRAGYVLCGGGRAPYGYTYVSEPHKGWFEINPDEADVVRKIYSWLTDEGLSSYAIAKRLWDENVLTRGDYSAVVAKTGGRSEWSPSTVRQIIANSTYKGVWHYGKTRRTSVNGKTKNVRLPPSEWLPVEVPAIIDEAAWEKAQEHLKKNRENSKRNTRRQYLLRGLVFCTCGRRWTGRYKKTAKRGYYRCPATQTEQRRNLCDCRFGIRTELLENAVWETAASFILNEKKARREIERRRNEAQGEAELKMERLQEVETSMAEVDRKMEILLDQILMGDFSESLIANRKKELANERTKLQAKAQRITEELASTAMTPEREDELMAFLRKVAATLENPTFETKRRVMEMLEVRVDVISREKIKVSGVISPDGSIVDITP
jgi:site-specific DNA recombinase